MSDSNNVIGWSFAEWGMKESEILDLFKNNIKKLYNVSYTNPKSGVVRKEWTQS